MNTTTGDNPYCRLLLWLALGVVLACHGCDAGGVTTPDVSGPLDTLETFTDGQESVDTPSEAPEAATIQSLVDQGKELLQEGRSGEAIDVFQQAVDMAPDDTNAIFGLALSHMIYGSELCVMATTVGGALPAPRPGGTSRYGVPPAYALELTSQNEYYASELHNIFMRLRHHFVLALELLDKIEDRPLAFEVEGVPVFLGIKPRLYYQGSFGQADVYLMKAIGDFVVFLFDTMAGQDITTDFLSALGLMNIDMLGSKDLDARKVFSLIAFLLDQDERFLTIHPVDGEELFQDARERLEDMGPSLEKAIKLASEVEGSAENRVTHVVAKDSSYTLVVNNGVVYPSENDEGQHQPLEFVLDREILDAFTRLSEAVQPGGPRVTLDDTVLPVLVTALHVAAKVGLLDSLHVELPIDLAQLDPAAVLDVLRLLVPDVLAFDLGAFYEKPVGLRVCLPVVRQGDTPLEVTLMAEWECPDDLKEDGFPGGKRGFLCSEGANLVDSPHFAGSSYETKADGIASSVPVFAFEDPTMSGLVFVNLLATEEPVDPEDYAPADRTTLNAALALILENVLELLPQ